MQKKLLGKLGEIISSKYLTSKKYKILQKNYHTRYGELDIVAKEKYSHKTIVFVEVKTRTGSFNCMPESLSQRQIQRLTKSIFIFLEKNGLNHIDFRLDLIIVLMDLKILKKRLIHIKNILSK